jgi:hypothetical protein
MADYRRTSVTFRANSLPAAEEGRTTNLRGRKHALPLSDGRL